jgi:hypothetical protein
MTRSIAIMALLGLNVALASAEVFQLDFGPPGHVQYTGNDYGEGTNVTPSKPGESGENFTVTNLEYKLGDATLSAEKVGAFSVDGDASADVADAMTKSFIFANPENADVGATIEMKLTGIKPTDKVTFAFLRSSQPFPASVTVVGGDKKETKDVDSDTDFVTVATMTGHDTYTIQITHLADKPAEANIAGARITIEHAGNAPADKK